MTRVSGRAGTATLVCVLLLLGAGAASTPARPPLHAHIDLYSDGVVLGADGSPVLVPPDGSVVADPARLAEQDAWLAAGRIPGPERYRALAEQALRDLDALVLPGGAAIAAASPRWSYVWPRDASFSAAALARTGHGDDAYGVLRHLQELQTARSTGGVFEARYLPDGSGEVPDDRGLQLDGNGWVLWAAAEWYAAQPVGRERDARLERLRPLVTRSVAAIRAHVGRDGLPTVSPDYWEVREVRPTLGTLAPLLAGLRAAGPLLAALGEPPAGDLVALLERGLADHFAPTFGRHPGRSARDTAVAFLMPPFAPGDEAVTAAWREAAGTMERPAGGLAPGAGWKRDGISWTPTTATFALAAAASGDAATATAWLDWLDTHRTPAGALPEKVLADGSPAAVAPLAWTCALVLLTLDELDRQGY